MLFMIGRYCLWRGPSLSSLEPLAAALVLAGIVNRSGDDDQKQSMGLQFRPCTDSSALLFGGAKGIPDRSSALCKSQNMRPKKTRFFCLWRDDVGGEVTGTCFLHKVHEQKLTRRYLPMSVAQCAVLQFIP